MTFGIRASLKHNLLLRKILTHCIATCPQLENMFHSIHHANRFEESRSGHQEKVTKLLTIKHRCVPSTQRKFIPNPRIQSAQKTEENIATWMQSHEGSLEKCLQKTNGIASFVAAILICCNFLVPRVLEHQLNIGSMPLSANITIRGS